MVKFQIKVENVVSFAVLGRRIVLNELVEKMKNTEYFPDRFPGVVYRITEPKAASLIFSSGKIICTGGRNLEDINLALNKFKKSLEGIGLDVKHVN